MSNSASEEIASAAKAAFAASQLIPSQERIHALQSIKAELESRKDEILAANRLDLQVSLLCMNFIPFADVSCIRLHRRRSMQGACLFHF